MLMPDSATKERLESTILAVAFKDDWVFSHVTKARHEELKFWQPFRLKIALGILALKSSVQEKGSKWTLELSLALKRPLSVPVAVLGAIPCSEEEFPFLVVWRMTRIDSINRLKNPVSSTESITVSEQPELTWWHSLVGILCMSCNRHVEGYFCLFLDGTGVMDRGFKTNMAMDRVFLSPAVAWFDWTDLVKLIWLTRH
jgi:hypothetical protein